jgi:hypothetical protein
MDPTPTASASSRWLAPGVALGLAALTAVAFAGVWSCAFVNYDDQSYVLENAHVQEGLTAKSFWWALTAYKYFWHPLTWASLQLDHELYHLGPAGYHLTNLLLHIANTLLVFAIFQRMTGALWRSALVAALFALHPLHVESVAWVSERKDVLSTLFWLLTMAAYAGYVQVPGPGRYLLVVLLFALGLTAKPMLVTLPFVLLLLDYWPLGRLGSVPLTRLIGEKVPLLALSAAASAFTLWAEHQGGEVNRIEEMPLRLENAVISYAIYLRQMIWLHGLTIYYPFPDRFYPPWQVITAASVLVVISAAVAWPGRRRPYLVVGWLWYLGTLVPVLGLVQILGTHARADRYTYVPLIGVFVMLSWGLADLVGDRRGARAIAVLGASAALGCCLVATRVQISHWHNSVALWRHTLTIIPDNARVCCSLGHAYLVEQGRKDQATVWFLRALSLALRDIADQAAASTGEKGPMHFDPRWREKVNWCAWVLATHPGREVRNADLAVRLAEQLCQATEFAEPDFLDTLAAAYAEAGRFADACTAARKALGLLAKNPQAGWAQPIDERLRFYEHGQPYRDVSGGTSKWHKEQGPLPMTGVGQR